MGESKGISLRGPLCAGEAFSFLEMGCVGAAAPRIMFLAYGYLRPSGGRVYLSNVSLSSRALANVVGLDSSTCTLANEARQRASVQEARAAGPHWHGKPVLRA